MTRKIILQRKRIFIAVEGEGEQSFIKFIQQLSSQQGLHVHLDCEILKGGGYKTMLERAIRYRSRKERYKAEASILLVDADRAEKDDGWSLEQLRAEAQKNKIDICLQTPNQEGLFLRLLPGKQHLRPNANTAHRDLCKEWHDYQKPIDARTLMSKFSLDDLLRVANVDKDLKLLLTKIGFH
ncbi:MAG: hypothetical protein EPO11_02875 [Gammaproteobacteria bacterium]|nr:MAG: hypothetical protein EPO11_02875 [Gammaproteobacteria bacterium]